MLDVLLIGAYLRRQRPRGTHFERRFREKVQPTDQTLTGHLSILRDIWHFCHGTGSHSVFFKMILKSLDLFCILYMLLLIRIKPCFIYIFSVQNYICSFLLLPLLCSVSINMPIFVFKFKEPYRTCIKTCLSHKIAKKL